MIRSLAILAATTSAVLATTAEAQPAGYYVATPIAAPAHAEYITNEMMWTWSDTAFVARQGPHRDLITCELIAQRAGKLASFTAAGTAFDADALAKCNARVK